MALGDAIFLSETFFESLAERVRPTTFFLLRDIKPMPSAFDGLQIGHVATSAKGAKVAPIWQNGDCPALWRPAEHMTAVYEPSVYQDPSATRLNLVLRPTPGQETELRELDEWCISCVASQSERLLGKDQSVDELRLLYQPCLRTSEKYPANVRVKLNLCGVAATRFWGEDGKKATAPASWTGSAVLPCIRIKGLWFMAKQFGIVLELTDARITENRAECPFK